MKIYVNAEEVTTEASSGANINVYGKSTTFSGRASSGSGIDADELESVDAYTKASSGANINVNVLINSQSGK